MLEMSPHSIVHMIYYYQSTRVPYPHVGMSVDVAFETPEQVAAKLAHYEELFKFRYTERDDEYRQCLNNASRLVEELMYGWTSLVPRVSSLAHI